MAVTLAQDEGESERHVECNKRRREAWHRDG